MSKKYLFIGGPKDGERIFTDGSYPILISPDQSGPIKGCGSHSSSDDYLYNLHRVSDGNDCVEFYALGSISYVDTIQMLIDNYQPKPVVSGRVSLDDFSPEAVQDLIQQIKTSNEASEIDWAKEPERMAEKVNFIYIEHDDLVSPGDFFNKAYRPTIPNTVLVFQDEESLDWARNLNETFHDDGTGLFFAREHWCIKGQEKVFYPEGE